MKQGILLWMALGFFALDSHAQKVYTQDDNGRTMYIIECVGMPAGSYTKTPKPRTTDGDDLTEGSNTEANLGSAVNNKKLAYKFEVEATVAPNSYAGWLDSVNRCAGLSGGNWRLPTQRELQLILIFRSKLESFAGFIQFMDPVGRRGHDHWSATETGDKGFIIELSFHLSELFTKSLSNHSRCIRDM